MTLSTSAIKRTGIWYLAATIFVLVFGVIYEYFSHDVFSYYMAYGFTVPLVGGILAQVYLLSGRALKVKSYFSVSLLTGGVVWLTLGSLFEGALQIYGTTNKLIWVFLIVGAPQVIISVIWQAVALMRAE